MKNAFIFIAPALFPAFVSASDIADNSRVAQLILSNPEIMASVEAEIKTILPRLKMEFSGIEVNSSREKYSAVMTYTDTAESTLFDPSFGDCSVLVRGKVISNSSITVDSITEDDCGE